MRALALAVVSALSLSACYAPAEAPAPEPAYKCTHTHSEFDVGEAFTMYAITGSKLMGAVAGSKDVCDEWSDGQDHSAD